MRLFSAAATQELVLREIFASADWVELDKGTLSRDAAIARAASRTGLPQQDIVRLFAAVPASLTPIRETINLIHRLAQTDNRLFVLSNMHKASIEYLEKHHDIWRLFDGIVISSRVRMAKPEPEIYEHLLSEFELSPAQSVFVDDLPENLAVAESFGIRTIRFENPNQCRQRLNSLDCL